MKQLLFASLKGGLCYTLVSLTVLSAAAQKDVKKYREESEALRKEIWAWNKPEFKNTAVPAEYNNASRVVLARHVEIVSDSKKKTQFYGLAVAVYRELMLTEIFREAVKVNDKAAVASYSEFSFTQLERKSSFFKDKTTTTYIGVKVTKPDGTVREINADEVVLTKDEKRDKEAKLAIPDLQPGDVVDYFIARQTQMVQGNPIPPFTFIFFDDNPILNYSIHCEIGKKYAVEYRSYNGAPDFKQSAGEDDAIVLDAVRKNIPAMVENDLWISPYRQLPILRMNVMVGASGMYAGRTNARKPGQVYKNQSADEFIEDEMNALAAAKYNAVVNRYSAENVDATADDYIKALKKGKKNMAADSLLAELYYAYRFDRMIDIYANTDIEKVIDRVSGPVNSSLVLFNMSQFLKHHDVENKLVLLTSKYGPDMKGIMSKDDIAYMLYAEGTRPRFLGMADAFSPAFYIPAYYENTRQAVSLDLGGRRDISAKSFERGTVAIPGSTADQNQHIEKLVIRPDLTRNTLQVERNALLRGHYKSDTQRELVLFEDYYESERRLMGQEKNLLELFEEKRKSKKYADELRAAFAEARKKQKEAFESDTRDWFNQEITDLKAPKITNLGVRHYNPDFTYSTNFNMNGLVKKAGNNYIIEVGKLQGTPLKIEGGQRDRKLDVYATFARTIGYDIQLVIPEGYTAEGVSSLNKKVENNTGSFTAEATTDGKTVMVHVTKVYRNAFEPVANWANMLAFIDAANEWSSAKLLLKKK